MTVIDSHQHFWDRKIAGFDHSWQESPGFGKICRDFMPADLGPLITSAGVDATVFVQTQHDVQENHWALKLADDYPFIWGVVGWIDLASEKCEEQLLQFRDHPKFVGVRHVVQDEPDDNFILRDDIGRGLGVLEKYNVPFDLLFYARHLKHAAVVAKKFPQLPLVIDHLSKPPIKSGLTSQWQQDLRDAAECENVFCKLSGMVTEADWQNWTVEDLRPFANEAIERFGPERLMFGSDWPVCELAASYQDVHEAASELLGDLTRTERTMVMGATAERFYGLS